MSQQLIDHSPDLLRLRNEGFEVEINGGYLCIHHVPYVNSQKQIAYGSLVSQLDLANSNTTAKPSCHTISFSGDYPCHNNGNPLEQIRHESTTNNLAGIIVNHRFSNRPTDGYVDYFHKITQYVAIISAPAFSLDSSVTAKTFKVLPNIYSNSVFQYTDTNASRANINQINAKLEGQKIAIIGLGGTGSYILDKIAKSPVAEIHLFDGDDFLLHNAFRSPGAPSIEDLNLRKRKTDYYHGVYSNMHKHIHSHPHNINEANLNILGNMSFVFISIDKDSVKKGIIDYLIEAKISFIDVGLGVSIVDDSLLGSIRITACSTDKIDHVFTRISTCDDTNNIYSDNIQIAELNSLNADLAVIRWKKMFGFYQDLKQEFNSSYDINVSHLQNDEYRT